MDSEHKRNVAVGLTTVLGVGGLLAMLVMFGWVPELLQRGYAVTIRLPHAAGLHEDSLVRLSGIQVGKVREVRHDGMPQRSVVVVAHIEEGIQLMDGVQAEIQTPLLGGLASIDLIWPEDVVVTQAYLATDGSAEIQGFAGTLVGELQAALQDPIDQFKRLNDTFEAVATEWAALGKNLRELTDARDVTAVDGGDVAGNLATVLARADSRLAEMKQTLAALDAYVQDDELRGDVKATVANAREISGKASTALQTLEKRYAALADSVDEAVRSANDLFKDARTGEGTLGKVISDPALFENLNDAAERLQTTLDETRLLIQKWKAEGLPIQF